MAHTAHYRKLGSGDVRMASYGGVDTVAAFTDSLSELRILTGGCGIFDLGWRAKITAQGRDRVRWLNGMVTNTIKALAANHGNYNFVLNPQGRILGDLYAYNRGEFLTLDTDRSQLESLITSLKRFIIMDQVELADASASISVIGVCGPKAQQVLASAGTDCSGLETLELREVIVEDINFTLVRGPEQKPGWFEIWCGHEHVEKLWDRVVEASARPVGTEALEIWRVMQGIPQYGQDIRDRDLPQETEQPQALNFTKGCYIGQEIVERIRSRGQVHRKFTGFEFPEVAPHPGKFEENGRLLAEVTSVTQIGEKRIGLGYVRWESAPLGTKLNLNGIPAVVVDPPFHSEWN